MAVSVSEITSDLIEVATPGPQGIPGPAGSASFTTPLAVGQLPSSPQGTRAMVTDSTSTDFYALLSGGGTFVVPCFFDGTFWRVG
jgi:hypothetical protein